MTNSARTSEFMFLVLVVLIAVLNGVNIEIAWFTFKMNVPEDIMKTMWGTAAGWAVLRQNAKASANG